MLEEPDRFNAELAAFVAANARPAADTDDR